MPSISCGLLVCKHNNGHTCNRNYVKMKPESYYGRTILTCSEYIRDTAFLDVLTALASNPKLSTDREEL